MPLQLRWRLKRVRKLSSWPAHASETTRDASFSPARKSLTSRWWCDGPSLSAILSYATYHIQITHAVHFPSVFFEEKHSLRLSWRRWWRAPSRCDRARASQSSRSACHRTATRTEYSAEKIHRKDEYNRKRRWLFLHWIVAFAYGKAVGQIDFACAPVELGLIGWLFRAKNECL